MMIDIYMLCESHRNPKPGESCCALCWLNTTTKEVFLNSSIGWVSVASNIISNQPERLNPEDAQQGVCDSLNTANK